MCSHRLQLVHALKPDDYDVRFNFAGEKFELEDDFLDHVVLINDESTFHFSGKLNTHNVHIWGSEHPHELAHHRRDSPKLNVSCTVCPDVNCMDRLFC